MGEEIYQKRQTVAVIIVAGGSGTRMHHKNTPLPKQYLDLGGKSILRHTLECFSEHPEINYIIPIIREQDRQTYTACIKDLETDKLMQPVLGGSERQHSVRNGLSALRKVNPDYVLIHDGVRPFVSKSTIEAIVNSLTDHHDTVLPAIPITDTLKRQDENQCVAQTVDRKGLWAAQTPQGFLYKNILEAHQTAFNQGLDHFTDDTALMEWAGASVQIIPGQKDNIKITNPEDLVNARRVIAMVGTEKLGDIRVGTGYDVHAFEDGDAVTLGGISIPHNQKLKGHSDADVALHALTDAIFGALADGDIGSHFPPSDPQWKGAASDQFLKYAVEKVYKTGGRINHLDLTIICETPKIGPNRDAMREAIARICQLPKGRIAVKATTSEKLGFTGRKEGIAAMACATLNLPISYEEDMG
ncbi:bifunctional 2-C-methyl-D-erythritol 4-phosphate cytidylyltransferase/2-C-methyl-D-erythritol 2,4-cyclodiphosphate synthase [Flexibacterium corallicola]|uniref:bifunctional 2-C-methyl-D-erythritol 4-phosphate cytidylyltransferase/2-C-methyl-D-erythritol 2,4-cyclodiphosphate synthase n=1 Tax=Flexibacterium corallicola TaxID=3037259 RepID=UPI00286EE847|nr:bifunctional 2-C-methyl-D-erythritol 4-phosphate cytidylyltransferase/2-C-methyl-D-erythritol 2,4-cyclodiphosphate synthase [Pseudovibrio sp. M1P-2-3]